MNENMMDRESYEIVRKEIDFVRNSLSHVLWQQEAIREGYYSNGLNVSFRSLDRELSLLEKAYKNALVNLEKAKPFYPSDKQYNIRQKTVTVQNAIKEVAAMRADLGKIKLRILALPVRLFE